MDPISFCALCPTMQWFQQRLSGAWPPPFDKLALEWWIASDRGDLRLATRSLIPKTLHRTLATPLSHKDPAMHAKDFENTLLKRNKALTRLIEEGNQFLHDSLPGAIGPPLTRNNYFDSLGEFSTSRGHTPREPPKYCLPSPVPTKVLPPPKRKASDQPQCKKRPPPPAPSKSANPSALQRALDTYLQPVGPRPPRPPLLHHPAATDPRCRTRNANEMSLPPPPPHTRLIPSSLESTTFSSLASDLNHLHVSPCARVRSVACIASSTTVRVCAARTSCVATTSFTLTCPVSTARRLQAPMSSEACRPHCIKHHLPAGALQEFEPPDTRRYTDPQAQGASIG